ncbi:hypothetical protein SSBR45G_68850 [Bradyrhizobium sp. SSBR45G]|uniref:hypothetical protein n=1 Tax=unclassified Bradyrhizobium TaxID=2631580 RepID=UPI002342B491|nr:MULTISPECIES: hypothetical protein [unclassified Bradyrhizobium]GLH81976.1 hypothetical protein SSBR45G_68850 [Bradyrhizobium sp. SSBR45G]GLH89421.1 hypothetical protein SSBR45R_68820 [Bradyrhizobium sp. SSBR45R]
MGLFDWLKPKRPTRGPTPEGLYGAMPRGSRWQPGPDPAGNPDEFVPGPDAWVFDIKEWRWDKNLWIEVESDTADGPAGFGLVLGLSNGAHTDAVESWEFDGRGAPVRKAREEWTIPLGHPTRELALVSHGDRTTRVLRRLEQCFGFAPQTRPALPDKSALMSVLLPLRGLIVPNQGRFTMRMKVVIEEQKGWPYAEFFLNINSVRRQLWVSEKSDEYRQAILVRFSDFATEAG